MIGLADMFSKNPGEMIKIEIVRSQNIWAPGKQPLRNWRFLKSTRALPEIEPASPFWVYQSKIQGVALRCKMIMATQGKLRLREAPHLYKKAASCFLFSQRFSGSLWYISCFCTIKTKLTPKGP